MRKFLKPLSFLPAILLMYMIFTFSSQTGDVSSQLSLKVSRKIIQAGDYVFDAGLEDWQVQEYAQKINFITRKLAHMSEYFALALAVSFPLYVYGMHGILLMLVAGIICVGFACGDEFHQSLVAGRSPAVRDVAIDSFGVFWGIILVRIIGWTGRKTIFRPIKKKRKNPPMEMQAEYDRESYSYAQDPYSYARTAPRRGDVSGQYAAQEDLSFREMPRQNTQRQDPSHHDMPRRDIPPQDLPPRPQPKKKREKDWFFDL